MCKAHRAHALSPGHAPQQRGIHALRLNSTCQMQADACGLAGCAGMHAGVFCPTLGSGFGVSAKTPMGGVRNHAQGIRRAHLALQARPLELQAPASRWLLPLQAPHCLGRSLLRLPACLRPRLAPPAPPAAAAELASLGRAAGRAPPGPRRPSSPQPARSPPPAPSRTPPPRQRLPAAAAAAAPKRADAVQKTKSRAGRPSPVRRAVEAWPLVQRQAARQAPADPRWTLRRVLEALPQGSGLCVPALPQVPAARVP